MKFYPIQLNIKGKLCVVIGGGRVAERKVRNILIHGGKVRVVSPDLTVPLSRWVRQGKIGHREETYHPSHLKGASFVYAATSNRKVNAQIARDAKRSGLLVNVCDSAGESSFILPAVLKRKGITIAISTDGLSPAKSVRLRDRLGELFEKGILGED